MGGREARGGEEGRGEVGRGREGKKGGKRGRGEDFFLKGEEVSQSTQRESPITSAVVGVGPSNPWAARSSK